VGTSGRRACAGGIWGRSGVDAVGGLEWTHGVDLALVAGDYDGPTSERLGKGDLERAGRTWYEDHGGIGLPYLVVSVLTRMHRRGDISSTMKTAGERFAADFSIAGFDPRHSPDLARIPGQGWRDDGPMYVISARMRISDALAVLGGRTAVGASACWHVLGCEDTIQRWSIQTDIKRRHFAGILMGALSELEIHYGLVSKATA